MTSPLPLSISSRTVSGATSCLSSFTSGQASVLVPIRSAIADTSGMIFNHIRQHYVPTGRQYIVLDMECLPGKPRRKWDNRFRDCPVRPLRLPPFARETGAPLGGTEGSNPCFLHRRVRQINGVDAWRMIGRRVL